MKDDICKDVVWVTLHNDIFDAPVSGSAWPEAMSDGGGEGGIVGKVWIDMDRNEITRDLRVELICEGCIKTSWFFILDEIIAITRQWCDNTFCTAMMLKIC